MTKTMRVLSGVYTAGSLGLSTFSDKWDSEHSAIRKIASMGYDAAIITDTTILERAGNESIAQKVGMRICQGWIVMTTTSSGARVLLTLFSTSAEMERVYSVWSSIYPREEFAPMEVLPFTAFPKAPLFTHVPLTEIAKYRRQLTIFNHPLQGMSAVPYSAELTEDYYDGYFVTMDGSYPVYAAEILARKKAGEHLAKIILPHLGVGGCSDKETECLRDMLRTNRMFPLPQSCSERGIQNKCGISEWMKIIELLDSPVEFLEQLSEQEVIAALIPGAVLSTQHGAVELLPYELRLSDAAREKNFDELRNRCFKKITEFYADSQEMTDYAKEALEEEIQFLRELKGDQLVSAFLLLHDVIGKESDRCILLRECCVKWIPFLLGLSRFHALEEELGNHNYHPETIHFATGMQIEVSPETYAILIQRLYERKPGQVALFGEAQTVKQCMSTWNPTVHGQVWGVFQALKEQEKENLEQAVISIGSHNAVCNHVFLAVDGVKLPGMKTEEEEVPVVSRSFARMGQGSILFELYITKSETLARYEKVNRVLLQEYASCIPKNIERRICNQYLIQLDKCLAAGIRELTPLLRKKIREARPVSRYELAGIFLEYYKDAEYLNFFYYLQLSDIILRMIMAALAFPTEYYACILPCDTTLDWYSEDIIEAMVYDSELKEERTRYLLIEQDMDEEEYLMAVADLEKVIIFYAKNKRRYPEIMLPLP